VLTELVVVNVKNAVCDAVNAAEGDPLTFALCEVVNLVFGV
jgi:hypothetical protein